jgi:MFS family permease
MSSTTSESDRRSVRSLVPARLDRLPWARFHTLVVIGLGVSWILDGLEVQIVSQNGYATTLHMNSTEIGLAGTVYLVGQVAGALVFGWLSDRLGRRKLFFLTLLIYLGGSLIAAFSPAAWFFYVFRFVAGAGIGGEYAAINSAIDELIPSRYRGRVDIAINGTYWGGAALGALANLFFLNPHLFPDEWGWRLSFVLGPVLGIVIIFLRRGVPESPRWLMTHGHQEAAESNVAAIEERVTAAGTRLEDVPDDKAIEITPIQGVSFVRLLRVFFAEYPKRTIVGLTMMITQSFLYNAIFFTYALALENFYGIPKSDTSWYFFPFAIGNLLGPLVLGHLFDVWGRRRMVLLTYGGAGVILAVSAALFQADLMNAVVQAVFWSAAFFLASAGASSAYLTVSELFPLEVRSRGISYFFSIAQIFGALGPVIYGGLVGDGKDRLGMAVGYFIGAGVMILGGVITFVLGVNAERRALEDVADPLSLANRSERREGWTDPSGDAGANPGEAADGAAAARAGAGRHRSGG